MPPCPTKLRISKKGNLGASSSIVGALKRAGFPPVATDVESAPCIKQAGQRPCRAPASKGLPQMVQNCVKSMPLYYSKRTRWLQSFSGVTFSTSSENVEQIAHFGVYL